MTQTTAVLERLPQSTLNPLLSRREFREFCAKRFSGCPLLQHFDDWLSEWEDAGILRPAYFHQESSTNLYSTFQVWQISKMWRRQLSEAEHLEPRFREFDKALRVLFEIQDYYLPLVRSDRRVGVMHDYDQVALTGGFMMAKISHVLLSSVERQRQWALRTGQLSPDAIMAKANVSAKELRDWADRLVQETRFWDPLKDWRLLLSFCSYEERQKLRWDALLAEDYYEMALLLWAFLEDSDTTVAQDSVWKGGSLPPVGSSSYQEWLRRWYAGALERPFEMLEFLANQYSLNPKPRAIVFTEGEEWAALKDLYEYYQYSPQLLGIEFRSIGGEGRFKLANWQCFIEYMHEKQVLIYFLVDDEGETARQAQRLLSKKRAFTFPHLTAVIPTDDRIKIWEGSFEEANFTDAAIARCLGQQGLTVTAEEVAAKRGDRTRRKGLVAALAAEKGLVVDKAKLALSLTADLLALRRRRPNVRKLRAVEEFVKSSGGLIMLNHQPKTTESRTRNLKTGLLG